MRSSIAWPNRPVPLGGGERARQLRHGFAGLAAGDVHPECGESNHLASLSPVLAGQACRLVSAMGGLTKRPLPGQYPCLEGEQFGPRQGRRRLAQRSFRLRDGCQRPVCISTRQPQTHQRRGRVPHRVEAPAPPAQFVSPRKVTFCGLQLVPLQQHFGQRHVQDPGRRQAGHALLFDEPQRLTAGRFRRGQASQQPQQTHHPVGYGDAGGASAQATAADGLGVGVDSPLEVTCSVVGRRQRQEDQAPQLRVGLERQILGREGEGLLCVRAGGGEVVAIAGDDRAQRGDLRRQRGVELVGRAGSLWHNQLAERGLRIQQVRLDCGDLAPEARAPSSRRR